ncbi:hypothetical protein DAPPUDRAFT_120883, partial [Daphnia pulex]
AIDATYIRLANHPQEEGTSYINRKGFPGVSLQVVCDANRRILDASTGWPSSMQDSRIFRKSFIGRHVDMLLADTDYILLADGGYTFRLVFSTLHVAHVNVPCRNNTEDGLYQMTISLRDGTILTI